MRPDKLYGSSPLFWREIIRQPINEALYVSIILGCRFRLSRRGFPSVDSDLFTPSMDLVGVPLPLRFTSNSFGPTKLCRVGTDAIPSIWSSVFVRQFGCSKAITFLKLVGNAGLVENPGHLSGVARQWARGHVPPFEFAYPLKFHNKCNII